MERVTLGPAIDWCPWRRILIDGKDTGILGGKAYPFDANVIAMRRLSDNALDAIRDSVIATKIDLEARQQAAIFNKHAGSGI